MPFAKSGGSRRSSSSVEDPYSLEKLDRQIENAKLRAVDSGFKPDPDPRNWFEKLTNLPKDQNAFLDTLELIGRPGQAVLNVIDKVPDGDRGLGEAAWRGFAGKDRVRGSEIIRKQSDIENGVAETILGTGLEILTDPLNAVPAGMIAKGVGAVARPVGGFAKQAYNAAEQAMPALQKARETVTPLVEKGKDALGRAFVPDYKLDETLTGATDETLLRAKQDTDNRIRYMTEESMKNVSDQAKFAGLESGPLAGRIMEKDLRQFEDVKGYEFPDGLKVTENKRDLFDEINANRSQIKEIGKEIRGSNSGYQSAVSELARGLDKTDSEIRKLYFSMERQATKDISKQTRDNLREAGRELARVDSQINNFDKAQHAMLRYFKKQIKSEHESNFDIIRRIRSVAPNGIRGVDRKELPSSLQNFVRQGGKGIDEVADELGYKYADELVQDLKSLNGVPRKLDDATVTRFAKQEMERTGAVKSLEEDFNGLIQSKQTLQQSVKEIQKGIKKELPSKASEKVFGDLSSNERYLELTNQRNLLKGQLDGLRGESKQVREAKISDIKKIEDEIAALKESVRNPVMIQKELQRPVREMPSDPGIQKAANNLMQSNAELRAWAEQNGVELKELEGYMTHVLSQAERKWKERTKGVRVDGGNRGLGQPNKGVVKARELTGSVEDINEKMVSKGARPEGHDFFEPNAFFSTAIGQKRLIEYVNAVNFRRQVLSNKSFARKFEKGKDVPPNAVVIDTNNYKFLPDELGTLDEEIGGQYIVTKSVKAALDRYKKLTSDEGINSFLQAYDGVQSFWKRLTLFSPGYHIRNDVGAKFNNWVAGMNTIDLARYSSEASKEVYQAAINGKESPLFTEFRKQGLGSSGLSAVEFARRGQEPEDAIRKTIEKRSQFDGTLGGRLKAEVKDLKNPLNVFETSRSIGDAIDQTNRFALFKWFVDKNKGKYQSEAELYREAAAKVREVQFDYSKTTALESEVLTRIAPFYRWIRNNLPFQIRQFVNNPSKYSNINKLRLNAQDSAGIEEENTPEFLKEQFAMPVDTDKFLGLNLPLGDLTKISDPLKLGVDSLTPLIKTPIELSTNFNMFYKKPIEQFEGQTKQYELAGLEGELPIKAAYALEQGLGQIGRGFSQYLQKLENVDQDTKFRLPRLGIGSIVKDFDAEKSAYFERYEQLKALQDYLKYIEQQTGITPRPVREIR